MVGAFCVGGGYASIPLIQTQVIDVHHWISFSEFMDVVAISQMTPGPIGINAATFVGTKVAGIGGDNLTKKEYVTDDMICGVLVGFYKDGKKYIDCQNSKAYKLYSKIWVALLPVRPFILLFPRGINWIKRHIFKKR